MRLLLFHARKITFFSSVFCNDNDNFYRFRTSQLIDNLKLPPDGSSWSFNCKLSIFVARAQNLANEWILYEPFNFGFSAVEHSGNGCVCVCGKLFIRRNWLIAIHVCVCATWYHVSHSSSFVRHNLSGI